MSCFCQLEQEVARVGLLASCVEPGLSSLEPGAGKGGDVQEDGAGERRTEAGGRREEVNWSILVLNSESRRFLTSAGLTSALVWADLL